MAFSEMGSVGTLTQIYRGFSLIVAFVIILISAAVFTLYVPHFVVFCVSYTFLISPSARAIDVLFGFLQTREGALMMTLSGAVQSIEINDQKIGYQNCLALYHNFNLTIIQSTLPPIQMRYRCFPKVTRDTIASSGNSGFRYFVRFQVHFLFCDRPTTLEKYMFHLTGEGDYLAKSMCF